MHTRTHALTHTVSIPHTSTSEITRTHTDLLRVHPWRPHGEVTYHFTQGLANSRSAVQDKTPEVRGREEGGADRREGQSGLQLKWLPAATMPVWLASPSTHGRRVWHHTYNVLRRI